MIHCNRGKDSTVILAEKRGTWVLLYGKERAVFHNTQETLQFLTNLQGGHKIPFSVFDMLNDRCMVEETTSQTESESN